MINPSAKVHFERTNALLKRLNVYNDIALAKTTPAHIRKTLNNAFFLHFLGSDLKVHYHLIHYV